LKRLTFFVFAVLAAAPALAQTPPPATAPPSGQPPAPPHAPAPPSPGTLSEGSRPVTVSSGVNSLSLGVRAQLRWTLDDREAFDADTAGPGVGHADGLASGFDFTRLRLNLAGTAYRPWLRYQFQIEMSRTSGESGNKIKDAFFEIRPAGKLFRVVAGQFKAPFGLQQITSSGRLQFVDRAITDAKFNPSRDQGAMLSGSARGRKFGYDVGVFNGTGEAIRQNNASYLWVGRAYFNPLGVYILSETANDAPARPLLHLGVAVRGGDTIRGRTAAGAFENADSETALGLEFAYRASRVFLTAEQFWMRDEQQVPTAGRDIKSHGFHAQAGYMVKPRTIDVGVQLARVNPDTEVDEAGVSEVRGVFGYFFQGHSLKLQTDVGQVSFGSRFSTLSARARQGLPALGTRLATGRHLSDTQARVQLQLSF
jgi:phosphate-selective porin OprO and OprP